VETTDGAHETALAPVPCAGKIDASVEPSSFCQLCESVRPGDGSLWKLRTEIFPSLDAQARIGPRSYGAHAIEFTSGVSWYDGIVLAVTDH